MTRKKKPTQEPLTVESVKADIDSLTHNVTTRWADVVQRLMDVESRILKVELEHIAAMTKCQRKRGWRRWLCLPWCRREE